MHPLPFGENSQLIKIGRHREKSPHSINLTTMWGALLLSAGARLYLLHYMSLPIWNQWSPLRVWAFCLLLNIYGERGSPPLDECTQRNTGSIGEPRKAQYNHDTKESIAGLSHNMVRDLVETCLFNKLRPKECKSGIAS